MEAWKAAGVTLVIVGCIFPDLARRQMQVCKNGGLRVHAYQWVAWHLDIGELIDEVLRASRGLADFVWLDCEQDVQSRSAYEICQLIEKAHLACGNFPHGIYTRGSWWRLYTADSDRWSELPLWDAYYDGEPSLDKWGGPYGGWHQPWMKQYAENVVLGGKTIDINVYSMES